MTKEEKLTVLAHIAQAFQKEAITWAVGASLLLYLKHIVDTFHDIDLMVKEEDAYKAEAILAKMGTAIPQEKDSRYKTKVFREFIIDNVEIDMIAGYVITCEQEEHYFPLTSADIEAYCMVQNTRIPLQSVRSWQQYYELMGRTEKAEIIARWLNQHSEE